MIPNEVAEWIFPKFMETVQDLPTIKLPCGVSLKFTVGESQGDLTWKLLETWDVPLNEIAERAGLNAFSYFTWEELEQGVYRNDDDCWPSLVLSPAGYLEHNSVDGEHVIYIVDEHTAILTGSRSSAGMNLIREKAADGLAKGAMVINEDWKRWELLSL